MAAPAAENLEMKVALADLTKWLIQDRRTHTARLHGDCPRQHFRTDLVALGQYRLRGVKDG